MSLLFNKRKVIIGVLCVLFVQKLFSLQLGNGNDENQLLPIKVMEEVMMVSASVDYTMIVKNDHSLWATGENYYGQFGTDEYKNTNVFLFIRKGVKFVETANDFSLIICDDNSLWISGKYPSKLSSNKKLIWESTNTYKKIDEDVVKVSAGTRHIIYLKSDGTLWGVGNNNDGQLGLGKNFVGNISPTKLKENVYDIYAHSYYSFYIDYDYHLYLTGYKTYFKDTSGKEINSFLFTKVQDDIKKVSCGLILKTNGDLYSFGYGCYGALGIGKKGTSDEPIRLVMENVKNISGSQEHSLIVLKDGSLYSSGGGSHCNFGTIGDGSINPSYSFIPIMKNVKESSLGYYFSMVLKDDNSLWAFGVNRHENALAL